MAEFERLPPLIRLEDGSLVAFAPESISQELFAATQLRGSPDSFLARELTDGVLHFLARSESRSAPSDDEIAELVVKIVRELGHPELSRIYEWRWKERDRLPRVPKANYSADLLSAHQDGLLHLTDLDTPTRLAGLVVGPHGSFHPDRPSIREAIQRAATLAGQFIALDGLESVLSEDGQDLPGFVRELQAALIDSKLTSAVNLNCSSPPSWAADPKVGPLFAGKQLQFSAANRSFIADSLLRILCDHHIPATQIWWHLCDSDFENLALPRLLQVIDLALDGHPIQFVFDQPRKPVILGPGLDRKGPAVLTVVGVNLSHLVQQISEPNDRRDARPTGVSGTGVPPVYLKKLGSLARFAKTAGHIRQDYLRKHGDPYLREAFLLDRAKLVVSPIDLDGAVRSVLGNESSKTNAAAEFAGQVLAEIQEALLTDRPRSMFCHLDTALNMNDAISLRDTHLPPRQQVRHGATLQRRAGGGMLELFLNHQTKIDSNQVVELLHFAQQSEVARLQILWTR